MPYQKGKRKLKIKIKLKAPRKNLMDQNRRHVRSFKSKILKPSSTDMLHRTQFT